MMLFAREARDLDRERADGYTCLYFERYIVFGDPGHLPSL
jgi:hypothetical protein